MDNKLNKSRVFYVFVLMSLMSLMTSCSKKVPSISLEKCEIETQVAEVYTNVQGSVVILGESFYIEVGNNTRLDPCNLPSDFKKNGTDVIFSGQSYHPLPNVRRVGLATELTKIMSK